MSHPEGGKDLILEQIEQISGRRVKFRGKDLTVKQAHQEYNNLTAQPEIYKLYFSNGVGNFVEDVLIPNGIMDAQGNILPENSTPKTPPPLPPQPPIPGATAPRSSVPPLPKPAPTGPLPKPTPPPQPKTPQPNSPATSTDKQPPTEASTAPQSATAPDTITINYGPVKAWFQKHQGLLLAFAGGAAATAGVVGSFRAGRSYERQHPEIVEPAPSTIASLNKPFIGRTVEQLHAEANTQQAVEIMAKQLKARADELEKLKQQGNIFAGKSAKELRGGEITGITARKCVIPNSSEPGTFLNGTKVNQIGFAIHAKENEPKTEAFHALPGMHYHSEQHYVALTILPTTTAEFGDSLKVSACQPLNIQDQSGELNQCVLRDENGPQLYPNTGFRITYLPDNNKITLFQFDTIISRQEGHTQYNMPICPTGDFTKMLERYPFIGKSIPESNPAYHSINSSLLRIEQIGIEAEWKTARQSAR